MDHGEGNGNPLQCSRLENPMDKGVRWATVHRVTKRQDRLCARMHAHTHTHTHTQLLDISQSDLQETKRLRLKLARQPPKWALNSTSWLLCGGRVL